MYFFLKDVSLSPLFTEKKILLEQVFYPAAAVLSSGNIGTIGFHMCLTLNSTFA